MEVRPPKKLAAYSAFEYSINAVTIFYTYKLIIQHAGVEALGVWSLITAIIAFGKFGDISGTLAIVKEIAPLSTNSDMPRIKKTISTASTIFTITYGVIGLSICTITAALINSEKILIDPQYINLILFAPMAIFFTAGLSQMFSAILQALHWGHLKSIANIATYLLQALSATIFIPSYGLKAMVLSNLLQAGLSIMCMVSLVIYYSKFKLQEFKPCKFTAKKIFGLSIKTQINAIANGSIEPMLKVIILNKLGAESLGIFEIGLKSTQVLRGLIGSIINSQIPKIMQKVIIRQNINPSNTIKNAHIVSALMGMTFLMALLPPVLSWIWVKEINAQLTVIFSLNLLTTFSAALGAPFYISGIARGKININILIGVFSALSAIALSIIMTERLGLVGASSAMAISMIMSTILTIKINRSE